MGRDVTKSLKDGGLLRRLLGRGGQFPGVQSRQHVREVLEKERAIADRTGLQFSLVVFRIQGRRAWSRTIHRLSHAMVERIRTTDEVGWFDGAALCAILRATAGAGAMRFAEDVSALLDGKVARPAYTVYTYPDPPNAPANPTGEERRGGVPAAVATAAPRTDGAAKPARPAAESLATR